MKQNELKLLKQTLEEARDSNTGNHWLPESYAQDLAKCLRIVNRELRGQAPPKKAKHHPEPIQPATSLSEYDRVDDIPF